MDAAALLRRARVDAGLSQNELARSAGVAQSVISAYENGRREPSLPQLERLVEATGHRLSVDLEPGNAARTLPDTALGRRVRRHRAALLRAVHRAGAGNLRAFGSVARGDAHPDSDVDLVVDMPAGAGLFALQDLEGELTRILGAGVDLSPADSLKPRVRAAVEREAVPV